MSYKVDRDKNLCIYGEAACTETQPLFDLMN